MRQSTKTITQDNKDKDEDRSLLGSILRCVDLCHQAPQEEVSLFLSQSHRKSQTVGPADHVRLGADDRPMDPSDEFWNRPDQSHSLGAEGVLLRE